MMLLALPCRLWSHGRVGMTRSGLEGFAYGLTKDDKAVAEATGNALAARGC